MTISIVIPVFNRQAFTRQCLDRVWRHTTSPSYEVIVVDNGSTDGTEAWLRSLEASPPAAPLRYHRNDENLGFARACNQGARLAAGRYLLFLNNDTLVQPGWLEAMVGVAQSDATVGIVGIQQLFPYSNVIHHTGIVMTADRGPQHLYPHSSASLPHVKKQRDYQAVNGACFLIPTALFAECGGLDEGYRNGYEDVDLCLTVRTRGRRVVCCTSAFIYHYGQITETRTADEGPNARRFAAKWSGKVHPDEERYFREDVATLPLGPRPTPRPSSAMRVYLADELALGTAFAWVYGQLALALSRRGVEVALPAGPLTETLGKTALRALRRLQVSKPPTGGIQVKWSHYWPQHQRVELDGDVNLEVFVINYAFADPGREPWDQWLQSLRQNHYGKLPTSSFCRDVLVQAGVPSGDCFVVSHGYSPEVDHVQGAARRDTGLRLLTVTNSHDLERYGTALLVDSYREAFAGRSDVTLVVHDYGASSGDATLRALVADGPRTPRIDLRTSFLSKEDLVRLYRSCDAFVSSHRGEGFGMKILDALACGLPTVATAFGGNTDFCDTQTSRPLEYDLVPVGPCLDARSLTLANDPVWAEPRRDALRRELLWLADNRGAARELGRRAGEAVRGRFTWDAAAGQLLAAAETMRARRSRAVAVSQPAEPTRAKVDSPHWLGLRMSVVIPTFNRKEQLRRCLEALRAQTILADEFEVLVIDDGSSDGTEQAVAAFAAPFALRYLRQENSGPGAARNRGIREARGEHIFFTGDDIYATPTLLEEHLEAHARLEHEGAAVLGHVDWEPSLETNAVMRYICGESSLQFAYHHIPSLPDLDWRFFYTSNISVKRRFLVAAADAGIEFDPCFRHAAFEDSEYAYRLTKRGLRIHYRPQARVFHDHATDLASFCRREERAGEMAVVFCRKHPSLDDLIETGWIGTLAQAVRDLARRPEEVAEIEALDRGTDQHLIELVERLETTLAAPAGADEDAEARRTMQATLDGALHVLLDAARTRGKVREWYAGTRDEDLRRAALAYLVCLRKLQQLRSPRPESQRLRAGLDRLDAKAAERLRLGAASLESAVGPVPGAATAATGPGARHKLLVRLFALDRRLQAVLAAPWAAPGRRTYVALRGIARRLVQGRVG